MKKIFLGIFVLVFIFSLTFVSASRLPTVGSDNSTWGDVLNDFLSKIAGSDGVKLNETMVNGTNIYSSSINTTHIVDGTINTDDLADDSVNSSKIDLTEVTISKLTNDANYLDKDEGGTIDGSLIVNGNLTLIGAYLNATVTNQYLNGSFLPEITNIFDIGTSLLKWANLYVTTIYASKVYSNDWTNVTITESQITNLQSYLTSESDPAYSAWDKDYADLTNKPTIPTIWDETFNDTGDARWSGGTDTQKSADGNYLYNDTSIIYFNETKLNNTIDNKILGVAGDNSSWNESYARELFYTKTEVDTNLSNYLLTTEQTYNETSLINSVNSSLSTRIDGISGGNSSFNQSLTDTLYAGIEWDYNQTESANTYTDSVNASQSSWIDTTFLKVANLIGAVGNWSEDKGDYYNKTEIDDFGFVNLTGLDAYNETDYIDSIVANNNASWSSTYNETYAGYSSFNTTSNINSLGYLNKSGTNANQDVNISPYNFQAGNLTLTKKITFALGEIIDNIVDGWITITGNLNVTNNVTASNLIARDNKLCNLTTCFTLQELNATSSGTADGTGSWTNTSTTTSTDLNVNLTNGNLTIANGKVGIGTKNTLNKLEIFTGTTGNDLAIGFNEDESNKQSIIFSESLSSFNPYFSIQHDGSPSNPDNLLKIRAANGDDGVLDVDIMTFKQDGKVGIGTLSPNSLLEVAGDTSTIRISDSVTRAPKLEFFRGTGAFGSDTYADWRISNSGGNLIFHRNYTSAVGDVMTLGYDGSVTIGGDVTIGGSLTMTKDYQEEYDTSPASFTTVHTLQEIIDAYSYIYIFVETDIHATSMIIYSEDLAAGQVYEMGKYDTRYITIVAPATLDSKVWTTGSNGVTPTYIRMKGIY